jgi:hypothetical protein
MQQYMKMFKGMQGEDQEPRTKKQESRNKKKMTADCGRQTAKKMMNFEC